MSICSKNSSREQQFLNPNTIEIPPPREAPHPGVESLALVARLLDNQIICEAVCLIYSLVTTRSLTASLYGFIWSFSMLDITHL